MPNIKFKSNYSILCFYVSVILFFYLIFLAFKALRYLEAFFRCSLYVRAKLWVPEKSSLAHMYRYLWLAGFSTASSDAIDAIFIGPGGKPTFV